MRCRVLVDGEPLEFETEQKDEKNFLVIFGEEEFELQLGPKAALWNNTSLPYTIEQIEGRILKVRLAEELHEVEVRRRQRSTDRKAKSESRKAVVEGGQAITAPMPGMVVSVEVTEGQEVEKGQVLLILEAMKMENEIPASTGGKVKQVLVKAGDNLNGGDVMVVLD